MKNNNDQHNQPVCEVDADGTKEWCLNGKYHRVDGPAIECANGAKAWFLDDERHRVDGPAIEWANGIKSWYLNGKHYCRSDQPQYDFAKGLLDYLEAVEKLQNEK